VTGEHERPGTFKNYTTKFFEDKDLGWSKQQKRDKKKK